MKVQSRLGVGFLATLVVGAAAWIAMPLAAQSPAGEQNLHVDPYWPKQLPNNWMLGHVVGISIDSKNNILVTHRPNSHPAAKNTPPVIEFDQAGNVIKTMGG